MHDALLSEIGITRMRLAVGPQVEPVNDDADPFRSDASAFRFAWQDDHVVRHILPVKRRVEAAGERVDASGTTTIDLPSRSVTTLSAPRS